MRFALIFSRIYYMYLIEWLALELKRIGISALLSAFQRTEVDVQPGSLLCTFPTFQHYNPQNFTCDLLILYSPQGCF